MGRSWGIALIGAVTIFAHNANAASTDRSTDYLVKLVDARAVSAFAAQIAGPGNRDGSPQIELLGANSPWVRLKLPPNLARNWSLRQIRANAQVLEAQPNYPVHLLNDYKLKDPAQRARLLRLLADQRNGTQQNQRSERPTRGAPKADNPAIPGSSPEGSGADPLFDKQWGVKDMGASAAWTRSRGEGVVVAVIDTGVDYTHEDLIANLWRNPGETGTDAAGRDRATNGADDDGNGFVDDSIGWDFAANDNKPYDLSVEPMELLFGGGNPGHGTHCAGNVAARGDNGKGLAGVAPNAKIMSIRFLNEKGAGTTADAVKAINYAVMMGAKVLSNSWGSEGEDPAQGDENKALRDAIKAARDKGVLFVAAAGNGHSGVGYDNDTDAKPAYPASYDIENIVSVAALDASDKLGAFSNWGKKTVHVGAPGVAVFSTTVGNNYSDLVVDLFGMKVTWDGTSMATPHVAGAAALFWAAHPNATVAEVKDAIVKSAKPVSALQNKSVSGGKANAQALMAL